MPEKPLIHYRSIEVDGLPMRPATREVVRKAVNGHPVEVRSTNDYLNLYHVFERLLKRSPKLKNHRIVRRQIDRSRWRVMIRPVTSEAPDHDPEGDYNPKRGRYKRYARRLVAGETLVLESRQEAVKARRAWQLYVPARNRRDMMSKVTKVGAGPKHEVRLLRRASRG